MRKCRWCTLSCCSCWWDVRALCLSVSQLAVAPAAFCAPKLPANGHKSKCDHGMESGWPSYHSWPPCSQLASAAVVLDVTKLLWDDERPGARLSTYGSANVTLHVIDHALTMLYKLQSTAASGSVEGTPYSNVHRQVVFLLQRLKCWVSRCTAQNPSAVAGVLLTDRLAVWWMFLGSVQGGDVHSFGVASGTGWRLPRITCRRWAGRGGCLSCRSAIHRLPR
jgi:hypothetical protein